MKAKDNSIQLLQQQLDDLVVVRARGEIEQDKFLQRTIEIQQQMEALRQSKAQIASEDYNPGRLDTACFEAYLFLVVMNWFDGLVIDLLWVGHSKIWRIEGMEGVPYVKPWRTVCTKRSAATALYLLVAAAVGGIVVLIGKI